MTIRVVLRCSRFEVTYRLLMAATMLRKDRIWFGAASKGVRKLEV